MQKFRDTVERKREKSMQGGGVCRGSAREKKKEETLSFQSRTTSLLYLALWYTKEREQKRLTVGEKKGSEFAKRTLINSSVQESRKSHDLPRHEDTHIAVWGHVYSSMRRQMIFVVLQYRKASSQEVYWGSDHVTMIGHAKAGVGHQNKMYEPFNY